MLVMITERGLLAEHMGVHAVIYCYEVTYIQKQGRECIESQHQNYDIVNVTLTTVKCTSSPNRLAV